MGCQNASLRGTANATDMLHCTVKADSPGHIHFWLYDDVTNNGVLGLQRKISIHMAFAPLLFWSLLSIP